MSRQRGRKSPSRRSARKRDKNVVEALPFGPCPFCGGDLAVTKTPEGDPESLFHSLPYCTEYEEKEVGAFIIETMDIRDKQRGEA